MSPFFVVNLWGCMAYIMPLGKNMEFFWKDKDEKKLCICAVKAARLSKTPCFRTF